MSTKQLLLRSLTHGPLAFLLPGLVLVLLLVLALGLGEARGAQAQGIPGRAADETLYAEIDSYLAEQLAALNIPGAALAIVEGDEIVHRQGFGAARPGGEAPTAQTPFLIGSLTKSVTALAIMQLVEAGKVELDAPVQRYLPWFRIADPEASAQISVRHLLNQNSGFSQITGMRMLADLDAAAGAGERQARALANYELPYPVGSAFDYSNVNYNLLGLIVEAASGERYGDYVEAHIFAPLEMSHSGASKAAARQDGLAVGHQQWFGTPVAVPDLPPAEGSVPAAGLISSAEDMGHYLIAHLNGGNYAGRQVLSPQGMAQLFKSAVAVNAPGLVGTAYGMGWFITESGRGHSIWHNGSEPDYVAYMELLPQQNRGLVLLANTNHIATMFALPEVGGGAASLLAGVKPAFFPWGVIPWSLRAFLLIPVLQIAGVLFTWRLIKRWRQEPWRRPGRVRMWLLYILLPVALNLLLVAAAVGVLASGLLPFLLLFMADLAWLVLVCGGFALVWIFVRSGLIFGTLRRPVPATQRVQPRTVPA
jgi:CubicO group peptidase (beta-lactamase class C family)